MAKKNRSPYVAELRDNDCMSTESHMQMFNRLVAAGYRGIHNKPGAPKPKKSGK